MKDVRGKLLRGQRMQKSGDCSYKLTHLLSDSTPQTNLSLDQAIKCILFNSGSHVARVDLNFSMQQRVTMNS